MLYAVLTAIFVSNCAVCMRVFALCTQYIYLGVLDE